MNILDIFDFHQLITEPTRITSDSQTLIDLCITNSPDKITASGTFSLGISDHSLVCLVRKSSYPKWGEGNKPIIRRDFKHFNETHFMRDLNLINFDEASHFDNPNEMWKYDPKKTWKLINELTSRKHKRLGNISKINLDNKKVVTKATEISDTFNHHFANIGKNLATNIGKSSVNPTQYLKNPKSVYQT